MSGSNLTARAYGVLGTHLTLAHAGRIYLWGPPGVLAIRRPGGRIEIRKTWGVDAFLGSLPLPFGGRKVPIYVSIATVFDAHEERAIQHGVNAGIGMVGFSVTIQR
jgi:hypothetical protein